MQGDRNGSDHGDVGIDFDAGNVDNGRGDWIDMVIMIILVMLILVVVIELIWRL